MNNPAVLAVSSGLPKNTSPPDYEESTHPITMTIHEKSNPEERGPARIITNNASFEMYPPPPNVYFPYSYSFPAPAPAPATAQEPSAVMVLPRPQQLTNFKLLKRLAIVSIFFFFPIGLFALTKAMKAESYFANGHIELAKKAHDSAMILIRISIFVFILYVAIITTVVSLNFQIMSAIFANKN